ncbi:hypothetical protein L9G15_00870 [Shewanella sp. A3A]|nr:hypothetical protein [Shewanella ferrihydritica]
MSDNIKKDLIEQLDTLVLRGNASLKAAAKADALVDLWLRWVPWLPVVPVLIFCFSWWLPWSVSISLLVLAPILLLICGYCVKLSNNRFTRQQALLQFGRVLHDKDRLTSADEFLAHDATSPFNQLAVEDARNTVTQALALPQTALTQQQPLPLVRRWPFLLATVSLSVLVAWLSLYNSVVAPVAMADTTSLPVSTVDAAANLAPTLAQQREKPAAKSVTPAPKPLESAAEPTSPATNAPQNSPSAAGKAADNSGNSSAVSAQSAAATPAPAQSSASSASSDSAQTGPMGNKASASKAQNGADAAKSSEPLTAAEQTPNSASDDSDSAADPQNNANQPGSSEAQGNKNANTSKGAQNAGSEKSGGSQSQQGNNSKNGDQNGNQGQSQGNGGKGQRGNKSHGANEALKKTRGVAELLLAVPMVDQLIGTPNAGREKMIQQSYNGQTPEATSAVNSGSPMTAKPYEAASDTVLTPQEQQLLQQLYQRVPEQPSSTTKQREQHGN